MRIALIHALRHSPPPIEAAFARAWPEAVLMNLLDDSLSADLARAGTLDARMTERFQTLSRYAVGTGADGILFTCSAFGPCIEAVAAEQAPMPVLKPNEAMIEEACAAAFEAAGGRRPRIGLLASFAPTLDSMPPEFPADVTLVPKLAEGALAALDRGDHAGHDRLAAEAAKDLADCDVIALAQFSLASAAPLVAAATGRPVFTTPDSAVRKLKRLLAT
ncbi:arylsulfatase [Siccirubricoccus deserti]|uniref:Arylsulfatase n=1 Tax=Siccirubricoccus deserti TaxID=2013562 RepID=A0A9X0UC77_9PROT|nr:arylsulfatase [Siccirubricoccus deserti]MBC4014904.1 arylsulfatase [Siccirubricoccus deserti]GGC37197.1 arylsulfatase [Siccirubricoccus deserti]